MKRKRIWILVADGARARLLVHEPSKNGFKPALDREFIGTNLPSREIASDRGGRALGGDRQASHGVQPKSDPHRYEEEMFAREIASALEKGRKHDAFDQLIVVAPPRILGVLRSSFTKPLQERIKVELNKDLTSVSIHDLPKHLSDLIRY